ncbi:MAG: DMT family transporter [Candidatus Omnitrophota bacterium]
MWMLLAFSCAFLTATSASISKIILRRNNEYLVGWLGLIISAPILLFILFLIDIPKLDALFFQSLLILIPLEIAAYILYIKAIKHSPLSLTLPFLAMTPVFIILTGRIVLGETINRAGISGIAFVAIGAYLLNVHTLQSGFLEPLRSISKERGSVYIIIVSFIYSITAVLGKLAINHSSAMFFSAVYYPIVSIFLLPLVIIKYRQGVIEPGMLKKDRYLLIFLGVSFALTMILHCIGISMTKAAYMIAVKRLSMVFAVFYGWILFKEKQIARRLFGALVMLIGVLIIAFAG